MQLLVGGSERTEGCTKKSFLIRQTWAACSPCGCACRGEYCTVSSDGTIRGWDIASHAQLFELAAPGEVVQCCAYHPDRHELACGFDQGRVRVFDIAETALLQEHKQHRQAVLQVVYLPSGKLLFSLGNLPSYRVFHY